MLPFVEHGFKQNHFNEAHYALLALSEMGKVKDASFYLLIFWINILKTFYDSILKTSCWFGNILAKSVETDVYVETILSFNFWDLRQILWLSLKSHALTYVPLVSIT